MVRPWLTPDLLKTRGSRRAAARRERGESEECGLHRRTTLPRRRPGEAARRVRRTVDIEEELMAKKDDFTEQEWETLRKGALGAGLVVSTSDRGFLDSVKE